MKHWKLAVLVAAMGIGSVQANPGRNRYRQPRYVQPPVAVCDIYAPQRTPKHIRKQRKRREKARRRNRRYTNRQIGYQPIYAPPVFQQPPRRQPVYAPPARMPAPPPRRRRKVVVHQPPVPAPVYYGNNGRRDQVEKAKVHTRNGVLIAAAANELFNRNDRSKNRIRNIGLGLGVLNELLR